MKRLALTLALAIVGCGGPEEVANTTDASGGGGGGSSIWVDGIRYSIIRTTIDRSVKFPLRKVDTLVQAGSDSRNRFIWHKVDRWGIFRRGALILAPTAYSDFDMYMVGARGASMAEKIAWEGYEVHGYSTRQALLPPNACASGEVDCSIMTTWGYEAHARDLDFIRRKIKDTGWNDEPAVGGISSGAGYALAAVNERPNDYAGLLFMDMIMSASDPFILGWSAGTCAFYTDLIDQGIAFDDQTQAFLKSLTTNEADWTGFASSDLSSLFGIPNFRLNASNNGTSLSVSSWDRIQEFVLVGGNQESLTMLRDEACAWAGDTTFTDNLGNFRKPILALKQGLGMGPYVQHTLNLTNSNDITVISNPTFGHLDTVPGHPNQNAQIIEPVLDWLDSLDFN